MTTFGEWLRAQPNLHRVTASDTQVLKWRLVNDPLLHNISTWRGLLGRASSTTIGSTPQAARNVWRQYLTFVRKTVKP